MATVKGGRRKTVKGVQRSPQVFSTRQSATGVGIRPSKTMLRLMTGRGVGMIKMY